MNAKQTLKENHIKDQLAKHGFYDVDGLTYDQLKHKLAVARTLHVNVESPANKYF